jgi:hypothetical protein
MPTFQMLPGETALLGKEYLLEFGQAPYTGDITDWPLSHYF